MITNTKFYSCSICANKSKTQDGRDACKFHKRLINLNKDFCSWFINQNDNITCPLCHKNKQSKDFLVYVFDDKIVPICADCSQNVDGCGTCNYQNSCGLLNDHSEPPYITKTVQQGMMAMQTQIKNPRLVVKYCQKCKCSDGADPTVRDVVCFKEQGGTLCPHWQILSTLLQ